MPSVSAQEYLQDPEKTPIPQVCVIAGEEQFLRQVVFSKIRSVILNDQDADYSLSRIDGNEVSFADVMRETSMLALFGSGRRLILVEQADAFISQHRSKLEDYVDSPNRAGVLLLQLNTFPSNLRLYKKIDEKGLIINCKALSRRELPSWLIHWSQEQCQATLNSTSADLLIDFIGEDLGVLNQEIKRLALLTTDGKIDVDLIRKEVGTWRQRKVWDLIDEALAGNTGEALRLLNSLISSGEAPIAILAQVAATLRKLAAVYQVYLEASANELRTKPSINTILALVGVKPFLKAKTIEQLKKLGPYRGRTLIQKLLFTDLDLKGGSRCDPKLILERFIVHISIVDMKQFENPS